jgi:hypothetical protein
MFRSSTSLAVCGYSGISLLAIRHTTTLQARRRHPFPTSQSANIRLPSRPAADHRPPAPKQSTRSHTYQPLSESRCQNPTPTPSTRARAAPVSHSRPSRPLELVSHNSPREEYLNPLPPIPFLFVFKNNSSGEKEGTLYSCLS